ncbi:hypothetical protein CMO88_00190 [Candidatus Woesearchaeota archaeon]|nr:hypothetical protein [Candidatus Woesearchaeota archaeon]|tara:strand:+ start:20968 stop:21900 length:933 start_codon:yes stop_codon:yes gene_type:complete
MTELRKDYFLERWVIIAPGRSKRPVELVKKDYSSKTCLFCPGNEHLTPKEIGRIGGKKWQMRWFSNKFPAVEEAGNPSVKKKNQLAHAAAYGSHEIIAETPSSKKQLWDLKNTEIITLLKVFNNRISELEKKKHVKYVVVAKNHGREGGASLKHSHTQVISMNILPPVIKEEVSAYANGKCNYCKVISIEKKSARKCFENKSIIAFAPYASRFNYELWILPKKHHKKLSDFSEQELKDLSAILLKALKKLKKINAPYNYYIHYSPANKNMHFHIELTPRLATWAGIELSSGITVNSVSPEKAARFYRGKQ